MPNYSGVNSISSQQDLTKQSYNVNVSRTRTISISGSDREKLQKATLVEKIGSLNISVILIGSLLIIGISVFLWFLVRNIDISLL